MSEQSKPRRYQLYNRSLFKGRLEMQTALHIGGGKFTLSYSDSPVVLTPEGRPFIPGSSFKGALRSTVEKLVPSLPESAKLRSCGLIEQKQTAQEKRTEGRDEQCSTVRLQEITDQRRRQPDDEAKILAEARDKLCHTCLLFGSPFAAARINVNDLYLVEDEWSGVIQVRDGVAIDRDSESAKKGLKYDFEVVPATTIFDLTMTLENATPQDLQLISMGLSDFMHGFGMIGGKRSRGLGACLISGLTVSSLELEDVQEPERSQRLQNYLLKGEFSAVGVPGERFIETHISKIFSMMH